jgi:hypothetical protein
MEEAGFQPDTEVVMPRDGAIGELSGSELKYGDHCRSRSSPTHQSWPPKSARISISYQLNVVDHACIKLPLAIMCHQYRST